MTTHQYDYIITGAGCAGLSLLYAMLQHPFFCSKQILVIDKAPKENNDRTWCFWETKPGMFEEIVHHRWQQLDFYSGEFSARYDILPYQYKMIRGIDFYNHVLQKATQNSNITFYYGEILSISGELNKTAVYTENAIFRCAYIFNSVFLNNSSPVSPASTPPQTAAGGRYHLLQHFKGQLIETAENIFDDRIATFMDFRVSQQHGATFVYVLPVAGNKALVEYTVFSQKLLQPHEYDTALNSYISSFLKTAVYTVKETEFGVIPMTDRLFSKGEGNIVNIGTAGGQTKASSGFTFRFIQKHTAAIVQALISGKDPHITTTPAHKRFSVYDRTLLNILHHRKLAADKIFTVLFKKNPPQRVLRFLDNDTSFIEELKIMGSVPITVFLPAALQEILRSP